MKRDMYLYIPGEPVAPEFQSFVDGFNKNITNIYDPIKAAIILKSGFVSSIFLTSKYIGIQQTGFWGGIKIIKKDYSEFVDLHFKVISLNAYFKNEKIKIGTADSTNKLNLSDIEKFKKMIESESTTTEDNAITFRINKEILKFNEETNCVEYGDQKIEFKSVRDVRLYVKDDKTVHTANLGGAVLGYFLVGGLGALIGSATGDKSNIVISSVVISVLTNDLRNPNLDIIISDKVINSDSPEYKEIDEISRKIFNMFEIIVSRNK